jgi:hypothetical protein
MRRRRKRKSTDPLLGKQSHVLPTCEQRQKAFSGASRNSGGERRQTFAALEFHSGVAASSTREFARGGLLRRYGD